MNEQQQKRLDELETTLTNHTPAAAQIRRIEDLRRQAKEFGAEIIGNTPPSRQQSLALTHLEDCVMRAVQAIVLEGRT